MSLIAGPSRRHLRDHQCRSPIEISSITFPGYASTRCNSEDFKQRKMDYAIFTWIMTSVFTPRVIGVHVRPQQLRVYASYNLPALDYATSPSLSIKFFGGTHIHAPTPFWARRDRRYKSMTSRTFWIVLLAVVPLAMYWSDMRRPSLAWLPSLLMEKDDSCCKEHSF